jgi:hypothetical protein
LDVLWRAAYEVLLEQTIRGIATGNFYRFWRAGDA